MSWELEKVAQAVGGRLVSRGTEVSITGVSTDSRTTRPGQLFVPLRGPHFDGHDFLAQAVKGGAAACLAEDIVNGLPVPVIQVEDTLRALGDLAAWRRHQFEGPMVGITGTVGKTTTKELLAGILARSLPGLKSPGNFNNLVGLPLTLCELNPGHRWAVLEMGMSRRGEIARLTEIAAPTVGIVTSIGPAHLEELGDLNGVARAKGELLIGLPPGGTAVVNADDPRVLQLPVANGVRRLLYGLSAEAAVRAEEIVSRAAGTSFRLLLPGEEGRPVRLALSGGHNVSNALAAAAAALALGTDPEVIVAGLESCTASPGRLQPVVLENGVMLLEDTYNANPLSVAAALRVLDESGGPGKRVAVLGDMLELGAAAADWHREIGLEAARRSDWLLLMGSYAAETAAGARTGGLPAERVLLVEDHAAAVDLLASLLEPGDRVLVKGSRAMAMEKIAAALGGAAPATVEE